MSRSPDHEVGESQGEREPHLGKREGDQSESMGRKWWTSRRTKAGFREEKERKQREPPQEK